MFTDFKPLETAIRQIPTSTRFGKVTGVDASVIRVAGLSQHAHVGDQVSVSRRAGKTINGEVIALSADAATIMPYGTNEGVAIHDRVELVKGAGIRPSENWKGRIVDAFGQPLDGRTLFSGDIFVPLKPAAPAATTRREMGARLETGLVVTNTILPIAQGQRVGIFAGSGVGKSTLMADFAKQIECDVVVIALIGERGRELREFVEYTLGEDGMRKAVVVTATSDQSPLSKRRAAWTAMAVAEYFRDRGQQVLLLMDSITRFAEAHREVALSAGESPSLRAFPPSTSNLIAALAERAGPGPQGSADITAIFTVLVSGSDMEEPIADITRGILDGHIVLSRQLAERGVFPAIDIGRSVSRCLPRVASTDENQVIRQMRQSISSYEDAIPMIQTGLYTAGSDPKIDRAISLNEQIETTVYAKSSDTKSDFQTLSKLMGVKPSEPRLQ